MEKYVYQISHSLLSVPSGGSTLTLCDINIEFARLLAAAILIWYSVDVGIHILCGNYFTVPHTQVDVVVGVQIL